MSERGNKTAEELEREAEAYCETIMAMPAMQEWAGAAKNEPMIIDQYEF